MKNLIKKIYKNSLLLISLLSILLSVGACNNRASNQVSVISDTKFVDTIKQGNYKVEEDGSYTSKEEVALYIYTYRKLPKNYIKKKEAEKLGWKKSKKNLYEVTGGKSIGGDKFSNYEKLLPAVKGRTYYECDIDYKGGARNAKRIVYADDFNEEYGFIFYTSDHYKTFEKLY